MKFTYNPLFLSAFCLASVAGCTAATADTDATENLVVANMTQNGSFENGAAFWSVPQTGAVVDKQAARRGSSSLRIAQTGPKSNRTTSQFIPVAPGDVLTATVWAKGQKLAAGAVVALDAYTADGTRIGGASAPVSGDTFDWKPINVEYTVPQNADKVFLRLSSGEADGGSIWFDDATVKVRPQSLAGANLLSQAGFEEGVNDWAIPKNMVAHTERDTAVKRSGEASLRASNDDPNFYLSFARDVPDVTPGDIVHISAWVKGENVMPALKNQGAGIFLEFYDKDNKYMTGAGTYPKPLTGTFDWTQVSSRIEVPANVGRATLGIYMRRKSVGTAWFDDVEVRVEPKPSLRLFFQYPNYQGPLTTALAKPWQASLQVQPAPDWTKPTMSVESSIFDVQGKPISQTSSSVSAASGEHQLTVQPPKELGAGAYFWRLTATDPAGKVQRFYRPIQVAAQAPTVSLDAAGFAVVDGKRFFPLGLYMSQDTEADMQRISAAGFNTLLSYSYGFASDYESYLDKAQKNGLKVVFSIKDMYPPRPNLTATQVEKIVEDRIVKLREKPALLAWYTNDELTISNISMLENRYSTVKALDPNHPVYQVLGETTYLDFYYSSSDIIGTDPYPVGQEVDLQLSTKWTQETMDSARQSKGVWMVPQVQDHAVYRAKSAPHPPSLAEMRNQAYQAIIGGAKGLIFYSYFNLFYTDTSPTRKRSEADFNKRWPDVAAMSMEIKNLTPALLNGTPVALDLPPAARVRASALNYEKQLLVMAANPHYSAESVTFTIPAGWKPAPTQPDGVAGVLDGTKLTLSLPSVGSGVFTLIPA